jgi:hypothetical protein
VQDDLDIDAANEVLVALDPGVGVDAEVFAHSWLGDEEALGVSGGVSVVPAPAAAFLPGVAELVLLPLAVNVASSALYDVVKRLVASRRAPSARGLEVVDVLDAEGRRVLVVRLETDQP